MSVPFTALFEIIRQNKRAAAAQKLQSFFNDLDKQRFCRNTTMRVAQLSLGVMQSYMSTKASNTAFPQRYADTKYRIDTLDTMNALFLEIYVDANFHLWFAEDFLSKDVRGWRKEDGSTYDEHFERLRRELVVQVNECTSLWREVINIRNQFRDEIRLPGSGSYLRERLQQLFFWKVWEKELEFPEGNGHRLILVKAPMRR